MPRRTSNTAAAPAPAGHYPHAAQIEGVVWASGQVGADPTTGAPVEGIGEQTRRALANLKAALESAGAGPEDVVRVGVYLRDAGDFAEMNQAYAQFWGADPPARTTLPVHLPPPWLIEIDAMAVLP